MFFCEGDISKGVPTLVSRELVMRVYEDKGLQQQRAGHYKVPKVFSNIYVVLHPFDFKTVILKRVQ